MASGYPKVALRRLRKKVIQTLGSLHIERFDTVTVVTHRIAMHSTVTSIVPFCDPHSMLHSLAVSWKPSR